MAHVRKQLRDWLESALKGSAQAGDRVLVRRVLPLAKALEPTLLIAIQGETAAEDAGDGDQRRTVVVRVTAWVKDDSETGEDTLDDLAVHVERTFANDPSLGGVALEYEYQQTEFEFAAQGEKTLCGAAMTFGVALRTQRSDPETAI